VPAAAGRSFPARLGISVTTITTAPATPAQSTAPAIALPLVAGAFHARGETGDELAPQRATISNSRSGLYYLLGLI